MKFPIENISGTVIESIKIFIKVPRSFQKELTHLKKTNYTQQFNDDELCKVVRGLNSIRTDQKHIKANFYLK